MKSFYERYIAGECEQVWDELYALGSDVRQPRYFAGAQAVARETMRRVRLNCEMLIPRLEALGWRFGYEWAGSRASEEEIAKNPPLLGQPTPPEILDNIEANNGLLPIALRAFYEIVGAINFVGTPFARPGWPGIAHDLDPLYIAGVEQAFGHRQWVQDEIIDTGDALVPFSRGEVTIAPDPYIKYFIAGVGDLYMEIQAERADGPLMFEDRQLQIVERDLTLVRYLRYAMQGGGLIFMYEAQTGDRPTSDLAYLTDGLWPI